MYNIQTPIQCFYMYYVPNSLKQQCDCGDKCKFQPPSYKGTIEMIQLNKKKVEYINTIN